MEKSDMGASSANNSSDFVRKLYKMLEDPAYEAVVRWGNEGDSFVVLENEKFTKSILPKHFKHSNFASFVRQLNKYDFHKVRHNNEESGVSPYGPGAWEFKHPEFQANNKDSLDNIKRKAPAPRKTNAQPEDNFPAQQIDMVNTQLMATQHQLQALQTKYEELANGHIILLQHVVGLQKLVKNHDGAMHRVMGFLHNIDAQRRNSRAGGFANGNGIGIADLVGNGPDDHPASPLQQASQLLGEFSTDNLFTNQLEQMQAGIQYGRSEYSTPSADHGAGSGVAQTPTSAGVTDGMAYTNNYDLDNMVYPVGQINGIDPISSEHLNNIPYSIPPSGATSVQGADSVQAKLANRKRSFPDPGWGLHKPRILLVEDDKTCARVGCKFLQSFQCSVDIARHGLEAVNKINANPNGYDLILMDIIMPHLDGISATVCIRDINPNIPVIAMTSNIRSDDIEMYFRYGMNDVLPKPFTKEGMYRSLEKHLQHYKRNYNGPPPPGQQPGSYPAYSQVISNQPMPQTSMAGPGQTMPSQASMPSSAMPNPPQPMSSQQAVNGQQQPLNMNIAHIATSGGVKDEPSPGRSPASSWHSPSALSGQSPNTAMPPSQGGFTQMQSNAAYSMTPNNPHPVYQQGAQGAIMPSVSSMSAGGLTAAQAVQQQQQVQGHRRALSDMSSMAEGQDPKRQRMYGSGPGGYP